ncbi:MAG: hypothetical protein ACQETH_10425 [Candidatus Rifleibacteriota bacterium]
MKKCSECGKNSPIHTGYCVMCGARLDLAQNTRRERYLFFLTPFFLILAAVAFAFELGLKSPIESGLTIGGTISTVFLFAGGLYWALKRVFRLPACPESYWQAGVFTIVQLLVTIFLTSCIEVVVFGPVAQGVGPSGYNKTRISLLAIVFLPVWFAGYLGVAARARLKMVGNDDIKKWKRFLFANILFILPLATILLSFLLLSFQPHETKQYVKAQIAYDAGGTDTAISIARQALDKKEDFAPLHYVLGSALIDSSPASHTPQQSLAHLQRACELQPENPIYLYKTSIAHDLANNREQAVRCASEAASLQENDAFLWQHLGELNLSYQNFKNAIPAYKKALELEPENPVVLNNLAYAFIESDTELVQALEMAKKSVELLPGFIFNQDTLAWAYYKNGSYAQALEIIGSLYENNKELSAEVDFHYAMILHANDLLSEPVKTFDKLLARPEVVTNNLLASQIRAAKDKIVADSQKSEGLEAEKNE